MSKTFTWLVTGSNRGIGFEFVKQLVASSANVVVATCRQPESATALKDLVGSAAGKLHIVALDVSDAASIKASAAAANEVLSEHGLDYLISNAGIMQAMDGPFDATEEALLTHFKANVAGPALVAQAYLPYLEKGERKVIVNVSSGLGSIGLAFGAKQASYSISKTALNMLTYKQAADRPDIISIVVDPGWVKTDMGGPNAQVEPQDSVSGQLKVITSVTKEDSGKYYRYDGENLPW
ncbi:C-factor [Auriscalpium vulgare]|uniref:C-factor n=1 Tax=Auriscalpium vulgare TaxID=40419 RepID=A0ACB8RED8_9AGAM|nr:C-factor [Auriscalpium vulgare]